MIHVAQVYPEQPSRQDQQNYGIYYTVLGKVLPCYSCRKNYQQHLKKYPIQLQSRQALLKWLHLIHNQTLIQSKKPEITYSQFINKYLVKAQDGQRRTRWLIILLILVTIAVGYYYLVYRKYSFPLSPRRR